MIYINKNESPLLPLNQSELSEIIRNTPFNRYATNEYERFVSAYGKFHSIDPSRLSLANGSDEWIQKCMIVMDKGPILALDPDFTMYREYANQLQRELVQVPCEKDFSFDLEKVLHAIEENRPAFLIFSQPNNPTGAQHSTEFVLALSGAMKKIGGYLAIDEAYAEFSKTPYERPEEDHIIYLRTLSKIYGLAGLRIGVAYSTRKTIALLNSVAHPYPLNSLSLNIGTYLLSHEEKMLALFQEQQELSDRLKAIFDQHVSDVIQVIPSETNFVFTYGEKAQSLGKFIIQNGFMPRTYEEKNLEEVVRYSTATNKELDQLESIVKEWRAQ